MTFIGSLSGSQTGSTGATSTLGNVALSGGISGLASGMDTDSIVNGLVQAAQVPLANILQQRQILQWKQEQYQQVNNALTSLQNSVSTMKLQSTFLAQTVNSSNSSLVTGTAGTLTASGTYSVSVTQMAQGATVSSSTILSNQSNYGDQTLASLGVTGSSVSLTINNTTLNFNPATDTINSVLSDISANTQTGVKAFYDANAGKVVMQTSATGSGVQINVTQDTGNLFSNVFKINQASTLNSNPPTTTTTNAQTGQTEPALTNGGTVEINGVKFTFTSGEAMGTNEIAAGTVVGDINSQSSKTGVTASYDPTSGQLTLTPASGLYSQISIYDPSNSQGQTVLGFKNLPSTAAADAQYSVNGYASSSPTNNINFNGLTLNLQGTTSSPVNLTVSSNTSAIVQSIEDFVKQYNTTMQTIQGLYYQQSNNDYKPLTTQQVSQMTQSQIDQWNLKAQSGLLGNDSLLGSAMDGLTSVTNAVVNGQPKSNLNGQTVTFNSLASIGLTQIDPMNGVDAGSTAPGVTTTGWNSYGLLQIDTTKLTAAVQADPQSVLRLFTNNPTLSGGSSDPSQTGIGMQMYTNITNAMSQITQQAGISSSLTPAYDPTKPLPSSPVDVNADFNTLFGTDGADISSIGQEIKDLDSRATDMQSQISDMRTRYQTQFSQMEQALSQLNSQSGAFSSMMGQSSSGG